MPVLFVKTWSVVTEFPCCYNILKSCIMFCWLPVCRFDSFIDLLCILAIPSESVVGNNQLHLYFECESEEENEVNEGEGNWLVDLKAREMHEKSSQG